MMTHKESKADVGRRGEKAAARYLKKQGFRILARNHRESHNELDIIASNRQYILFVEVKTRSITESYSREQAPSVAVHKEKQARTREAAMAYLRKHPTDKQPRLDVIEVWLNHRKVEELNHIPNAFGGRKA